jgi:NAD(P)-dependent dehydrogenase (short-subunit alcohol dehydrogenase family)
MHDEIGLIDLDCRFETILSFRGRMLVSRRIAKMGALEGKIAIVTGSGRGIGREIALNLASEGARIVVNDLGGDVDGGGSGRVADEVVAEIQEAGGEAAANYDSVATVAGGRSLFQTAMDRFGGLDILVNNAGILRDKTIFNMEEEDWDAVIAVHLKGHYCCTRPFAQYIRESRRPNCRLINFSSVSGLFGNFGQANYAAAKAGIAGFSRTLALELAKYGATSNVISPGAATRMTLDLIESSGRKVDLDNPLEGGKPIARVVSWLASDASRDCNGQIVHVMRGLVGIMQQPAVIRSFTSDHLWELDELDGLMPSLLEAHATNVERAKREGEPGEG